MLMPVPLSNAKIFNSKKFKIQISKLEFQISIFQFKMLIYQQYTYASLCGFLSIKVGKLVNLQSFTVSVTWNWIEISEILNTYKNFIPNIDL